MYECMNEYMHLIYPQVMMPPTIKKTWKWLVVTVYRAESLPVMDGSMIGDGNLTPFFRCSLRGGIPRAP